MKTVSLFREAWRNVVTGTARAVLFAVLLSAVVVGLVVAELSTVRGLAASADEFRRAGAATVTLAAPGQIDGVACEALSGVPGVRAAGALRAEPQGLAVAALPSSRVPLYEVTAGLPEVLWAVKEVPGGLVLSEDAAQTLGVTVGLGIETPETSVVVGGVYAWPDDGRRPGYGYAALAEVTSAGLFDECWVDAWPTNADIATLLRLTVVSSGGQGPDATLTQVNSSLGVSFDGAHRFHERLTRWAGVTALLIGAGLGVVSVRSRRLMLSSTLHSGVSRGDLARILGLETLAWATPAVCFGAAATCLGAVAADSADVSSVIVLGGTIVVLAVCGVALGVAGAFLAVREEHFFRYFQER